MYGELTDKETVARVEYALEHQQHDQFEILLYKKNSKYEFMSIENDVTDSFVSNTLWNDELWRHLQSTLTWG